MITLSKNAPLSSNQNTSPTTGRIFHMPRPDLSFQTESNIEEAIAKKRKNDEIQKANDVVREIEEFERKNQIGSNKNDDSIFLQPLTPLSSQEKMILQNYERPEIEKIWDGYEIRPASINPSPILHLLKEKRIRARSCINDIPHSYKSNHRTDISSISTKEQCGFHKTHSYSQSNLTENNLPKAHPPSWTLMDEPISLSKPVVITQFKRYNTKPWVSFVHNNEEGIQIYSKHDKERHEMCLQNYNVSVRTAQTIDNQKKEDDLKQRVKNHIQSQRKKRIESQQIGSQLGQDWALKMSQDRYLAKLERDMKSKQWKMSQEETEAMESLNLFDEKLKTLAMSNINNNRVHSPETGT